jgi:hypothetical protein
MLDDDTQNACRTSQKQTKNMQAPYIPPQIAAFANWIANFSALLTAAPTTYGLVAGDATIVAGVAGDFAVAYALSSVPATRTAPTIADTEAARNAAIATIRPYAVQISRNSGVLNSDKVAIGVNLPTNTRTPIPAPTVAPALALVAVLPGVATLGYRDSSTVVGKAKPFGAIGVEISVYSGVAAITDPDLASVESIRTKSPVQLALPNAMVGKMVTVFARFVTRSGPQGIAQAGPYSAPLTFVGQ